MSTADLKRALVILEYHAREDHDPIRWVAPVAFLKNEIERRELKARSGGTNPPA